MGIDKCKSIKKSMGNTKGETLVETIVSFAIFLIAIAAMTLLIRSATAMNIKAQEKSDSLEEAATKVEQLQGKDAGEGSVTITFGEGGSVKLPILVKDADPFVYFESKSGGGIGEK